MSDSNPYSAPKADLPQSPRDQLGDLLETRSGCCLVIGVGGLVGLVLGGSFGIRQFNAVVDEAVQQGEEIVDFLPVGVPFWALVGAIIGAFAAGLLLRVLRRWIDRLG